jgi:hypothetical protein
MQQAPNPQKLKIGEFLKNTKFDTTGIKIDY